MTREGFCCRRLAISFRAVLVKNSETTHVRFVLHAYCSNLAARFTAGHAQIVGLHVARPNERNSVVKHRASYHAGHREDYRL